MFFIRKFPQFMSFIRDRAASFRVGGLKKNVSRKILGGGGRHACGFLFNFSKVTKNANNNKAIDFFHIFSDLAIGSENSPSLN